MKTNPLVAISSVIAEHLTTQHKQSRNSIGGCRYRSLEGDCSCAVGVLIADEDYSAELENRPAADPLVLQPVLRTLLGRGLLTDEQAADEQVLDRLVFLLTFWQRYHDSQVGTTTSQSHGSRYEVDYREFSYYDWLKNGGDLASPAAFHEWVVQRGQLQADREELPC